MGRDERRDGTRDGTGRGTGRGGDEKGGRRRAGEEGREKKDGRIRTGEEGREKDGRTEEGRMDGRAGGRAEGRTDGRRTGGEFREKRMCTRSLISRLGTCPFTPALLTIISGLASLPVAFSSLLLAPLHALSLKCFVTRRRYWAIPSLPMIHTRSGISGVDGERVRFWSSRSNLESGQI